MLRVALVILFLVVPVVELAIIVQVSDLIGVGWTVALLIGVSVIGAVFLKREGLRAWHRFRQALGHGRLPTKEVVDGALVVLGGALLLTPGFASDALGLVLVFPLTRALVNRALRGRAQSRLAFGSLLFGPGTAARGRGARTGSRRTAGGGTGRSGSSGRSTGAGPGRRRAAPPSDGEVVDVEVVRIERTERSRDEDR